MNSKQLVRSYLQYIARFDRFHGKN